MKKCKTQADSNTQATPLIRYEPFNFRTRFVDTRREKQFLKVFRYQTMLKTPHRSAHIMVQSQILNTMVGTQLLLSASMADNPTVGLHGPKSTPNWLFFKIFKFSGHSLPGMTSFTLQPHFLSGIYYDKWWLSYPLRTSVKLYPMSVHMN